MPDSNTYKFSTRDNVKWITKNGESLLLLPNATFDWGWYGRDVKWTAFIILCEEYGPKTACQYFDRFARDYLSEMGCDSFLWTSGNIAVMLGEMEKHA